MHLKNLFFRTSTKKNHSHIKNLLEVALSDGNFDEEEMVLLTQLAQKMDISKEEIYNIRLNPGKITFHLPKSDEERLDQMNDLVCMMMVNGEINKMELKLCKDFALRLGFLPNIVEDMIGIITHNIAKGIPSDTAYREYKKLTK